MGFCPPDPRLAIVGQSSHILLLVITGSSQKRRAVYLCNTSISTTLGTLDIILQLKDTGGGGEHKWVVYMIAFAISTADDYDFYFITTQIDKLSW